MSTEKYPVRVVIKNEQGRSIRQCTLKVSERYPVDTRTFDNLSAGKYNVEYTPPDGFVVTSTNPDQHTFTGDRNALEVGIELKETATNETAPSEASSFSEPVPAKSRVETALLLTPISLLILGTLRLPIDFLPKLAVSKSPQAGSLVQTMSWNSLTASSKTPPGLISESIQVGSQETVASPLGNRLKNCLITNIRDLSGIPTFTGLVKKLNLVEVPDQELQREATQLYDQVDRFRQILHGCDPKLGRELIAASNPAINPSQPASIPSTSILSASTMPAPIMPAPIMPAPTPDLILPASTNQPFNRKSGQLWAQPLSAITILTCNGRPHSANFRSAPTIANWAILGMVAYGQRVYLTGRTHSADGILWHQAIAPTAVADPGQSIAPNQPGWIAGCFVR